jgi:uncharacterized membrane protein
MALWLIPTAYAIGSAICSLVLPRIEKAYFPSYTLDVSVASAQAFLSAAASGMMALTGIVFAVAFVTVQFSAIAYSPRLVLWFGRDRTLFHSLGIFIATFIYSLETIAWTDRGGSGTVPLFSMMAVGVLLLVSMLLFSWLVQRLVRLQVSNVLQFVGDKGRGVIREMYDDGERAQELAGKDRHQPADCVPLGPVTQTLRYSGSPRSIARFDIESLVHHAEQAEAVIAIACPVGDTVVEGMSLLRVHGANKTLPERVLRRAIHLARERTFEQDPKYPIRLLVDIAIRALSPAINDPTTAVQTIDQIEDLLLRLGRRELDAGYARDARGVVRLVFPMPTWEDYLALAFDEIRQYGASSVQVMRRLRSALAGIADSPLGMLRADAVQRYIRHLDLVIQSSTLDTQDRIMARQEDRQGLGLSRKHALP